VLPWSAFWEHNYFAAVFPWLLSALTNNYVRGGVSGLGVVNLAAGLTDLAGLLALPQRVPSAAGDHPGRPR
jgi:ABC-type transport system involved in cytochrome c biogenesis permease subunit